jgi:hypothetical protein
MTAGNEELTLLHHRLRQAWSIETSRHWSPDNPAAGQCGVTALAVNDEMGGDILKTDVNGFWHFYNCIRTRRVDFTMSQFSSPVFYDDVPSNREEALLELLPAAV